MRSSGSTPSPSPEAGLPLWIRLVGEDHPKACTGRRLLHRGLARPLHSGSRPITLDPHAEIPLTREDGPLARREGVLAVDCSWNRLAERGGLPRADGRSVGGPRRRLPLLLASNPQHFGRLGELNTVEALAAAAYLLGDPSQAARLLEGFRGGAAFLTLNRERLAAYARARSVLALRATERRLFST